MTQAEACDYSVRKPGIAQAKACDYICSKRSNDHNGTNVLNDPNPFHFSSIWGARNRLSEISVFTSTRER